MQRRTSTFISSAIVVLALTATRAYATGIVEYTFEAPQFTVAELTPILNVAPNVNPGTFLASFTDANPPDVYGIAGVNQPSSLFSGQYLVQLMGQTDALNLTFNTPVYELVVDFGLAIGNGTPAGSLRITTVVGSATQTSSDQSGGTGIFQGGVLTFASATPFTSATLQGFQPGGTIPVGLAIDNLQLDTAPVPEPATLTLTALGLAGALTRYRRRRRSGASL
jgi:hypothetical protein